MMPYVSKHDLELLVIIGAREPNPLHTLINRHGWSLPAVIVPSWRAERMRHTDFLNGLRRPEATGDGRFPTLRCRSARHSGYRIADQRPIEAPATSAPPQSKS